MNKIEKFSEEEKELYMEQVVRILGHDRQIYAEAEWKWNRRTIRKGAQELVCGIAIEDNFQALGRKRAEEHLPNRLTDIQDLVDGWSQTETSFRSTRLYTRITTKEMPQQLMVQKGYDDTELPTEATISAKMNALGYRLRTLKKASLNRKSPSPMLFSSA